MIKRFNTLNTGICLETFKSVKLFRFDLSRDKDATGLNITVLRFALEITVFKNQPYNKSELI